MIARRVCVCAESVSVVLASLADAALLDHAHANWRPLLSGGSEQAQQQQDERVTEFGERERELLALKLEDPTLTSLLQVCRSPLASRQTPPHPIAIVCSAGALRICCLHLQS